MEFFDIKNIAIYGTDCIADISQGDGDALLFVTAKEKYFLVKCADGVLTVTQKSRNLLSRIISRRIEFKIVLPRAFKGKLRFRNKNGGLYISGGKFTDVDLSTDNGKFDISNTSCNGFALKMQNGSVSIKKLSAETAASVKCSNGSIKIESTTAPSLVISCSNAATVAIDISTKKFECKTSNGAIDASAIAADDIRLETANGKITAAPLGARSDYKLSADAEHGAIIIDGTMSKRVADAAHAAKKLCVKTLNGDVDIRFFN